MSVHRDKKQPWPLLFLAASAWSGLAALIYEVTWTRLLTLYMGHSTASTTTVVGAFMGGLALGAAVGGRIASRFPRARSLYAYAVLELIAIASALLLPYEIAASTPLLRWAYGDGAPGPLFATVRFLCCVAMLALPATVLGATFPVAVRWLETGARHPGRTAGLLYAANTLGAAAGALAAGLILLPALGAAGTTLTGVVASGAAATAMLFLASRERKTTATEASVAAAVRAKPKRSQSQPQPETSIETSLPERPWLPVVVLGLSGFATLMFEIVWTRLLALILGPTTYAFSMTVAVIICGLAGGAMLGSWAAGRVRNPTQWLVAGLTGTAVTVTAAAWVAGNYGGLALRLMPGNIASQPGNSESVFTQLLVRQLALTSGLILPTALGLGLLFPIALEMLGRERAHMTREVGVVYATNAVAGLLGALTAGFVTIPLFGLHGSLRVVIGLLIADATVVLLAARVPARRRWMGFVTVPVALVSLLASSSWDRALLASGAYKYAPYVSKSLDIAPAIRAGDLLYYREGAVATVSVKELTGTRSLAIDGKIDASNFADMITQKLLAHLPLFLHSRAREICIIGLGSGVTLASALLHSITRADVLELSPEVVQASRYFGPDTGKPLDDPRTHLIVGDGRTHLLLSSRKYDVIISEPSNPWIAGVAALFTREFFLAARDRLAPGGIICQWAHTYDISNQDLRSIVATFRSVFPNGTLWVLGRADVLLVASNDLLDGHLDNIRQGWSQVGSPGTELEFAL